jgi:predicted Rossmann fold nucleotide-binding protein DprA/Smf involved in DNA uptake
MLLEEALYLILATGLPPAAVAEARRARGGERSEHPWRDPTGLAALRQAALRAAGRPRGRMVVHWPTTDVVERVARRVRDAEIGLVWRGEAGYPGRLERRLESPPTWLWVAGSTRRLKTPACAVVGSRQTPERLLDATRGLGRALAERGVAVVSGMARGADAAAHAGATEPERGRTAGTIAIPPRGLLNVVLGSAAGNPGAWTFLAPGRPNVPFSAAAAIGRNSLIAAMGDGLVLAASDLRGGSSYAVRWAIDHRLPLWCFEDGNATPAANRHLLRAGLAQPLSLGMRPDAWAERIETGLAAARKQGQCGEKRNGQSQLDWIVA